MSSVNLLIAATVILFPSRGSCQVTRNGNIVLKPQVVGPAIPDKPFSVIWNVGDLCSGFGINLDLDKYDIVHNERDSEKILIFYEKDFKHFPYFDRKTGAPINGGLPQNASLIGIMDDVEHDLVNKYENFHGLGVIDWESWKALFNRMNDSLSEIYRKESLKWVRWHHPGLSPEQQLQWAKMEYELATQRLMKSALEVAKIISPNGLWGFYLYPDCRYYNFTKEDYSCSDLEKRRNDEIQWLFDSSTALFPSMYIGEELKQKVFVVEYVTNRIREALRVDANRPGRASVPVYSYHMITYRKETGDFVDIFDLHDSIGVASLLGGSGAIIWQGLSSQKTLQSCKNLKNYFDATLGPFCKKTTEAAAKCSYKRCNGQGRCVISVKTQDGYDRYLTTKEAVNLLKKVGTRVHQLFEAPINSEPRDGKPAVSCQCYTAYAGKQCQLPAENV